MLATQFVVKYALNEEVSKNLAARNSVCNNCIINTSMI